MSTIVRKKISELKPHPYNEEIYGTNESIDELVASIRKTGKVATLIITDDNVIISGHRRWKSCQRLVEEGNTRFNPGISFIVLTSSFMNLSMSK